MALISSKMIIMDEVGNVLIRRKLYFRVLITSESQQNVIQQQFCAFENLYQSHLMKSHRSQLTPWTAESFLRN